MLIRLYSIAHLKPNKVFLSVCTYLRIPNIKTGGLVYSIAYVLGPHLGCFGVPASWRYFSPSIPQGFVTYALSVRSPETLFEVSYSRSSLR